MYKFILYKQVLSLIFIDFVNKIKKMLIIIDEI